MVSRPRFQRLLDFDVALARPPQVGLRSLASRARLGEGGQLGLCLDQRGEIGCPDCRRGGLSFTRLKGSNHPRAGFLPVDSLFPGRLGVLLGPGQEANLPRGTHTMVAAVNSSLLGHDGLLSSLFRGDSGQLVNLPTSELSSQLIGCSNISICIIFCQYFLTYLS